jgi:hypothetical protein
VTINRFSYVALVFLSSLALLTVGVGYTRMPLADEGALAHIFQLTVVAVVPTLVLFFSTAGWEQPLRTGARLAIPILVLALAFAALFYMEHYYYPQHYTMPHR